MYRIRFHGRGGQGIKTASRILGTALFNEGFEVQDAPRYGAERRGAPIFAYVRADRHPIQERGIIRAPDLVVVADDTLVPIPAAGVLVGLDQHTVLLIETEVAAQDWCHRLNFPGRLVTLPVSPASVDTLERGYLGAHCAGAAARLLGTVSRASLEQAIREEIQPLGAEPLQPNLERALAAYEAMAAQQGCVSEGGGPSADNYEAPRWVDLPFEDARLSAPAVHAVATSVEVRTGLWRTVRPVIEYDRCKRCWWVCTSFCPDSAMTLGQTGYPEIDYDHCKGCLICVAQCPPHAIRVVPEGEARSAEQEAT
ncbi:MAG: 2-oxoacid:acceptor oxidoreductase family protein [Gammaproteobacteria bacterium]